MVGRRGVGGGARRCGLADLGVHRGAMRSTTWSRLVCFDGLGPGEVTSRGAKVVGVSQRRTRLAARFQTSLYLRYDPDRLVALLARAVRPSAAELATVATVDAAAATVRAAFEAALAPSPDRPTAPAARLPSAFGLAAVAPCEARHAAGCSQRTSRVYLTSRPAVVSDGDVRSDAPGSPPPGPHIGASAVVGAWGEVGSVGHDVARCGGKWLTVGRKGEQDGDARGSVGGAGNAARRWHHGPLGGRTERDERQARCSSDGTSASSTPRVVLALPSNYRPRFEPRCYLAFGQDGCIDVMTADGFEEVANEMLEKVRRGEVGRAEQRTLAGNTLEVPVDGQGRITIDRVLRDFAGLELAPR